MITDEIAEPGPPPSPVEQVRPEIAALRSRVTQLEQEARTLVRRWPVVAVLAAAGGGYLIARILARRTR